MDKRNDLGINLIGYATGYNAGASGGGGGGGVNTAVSVTGSQAGAFWNINWQDLEIPDTMTSLTGLFYNLRTMNAPKVKFNSNITSLEYMFNGCYTPKIDMSGWDITNVNSFYYTFTSMKANEFVFPTTHCTASNVNCNSIFYSLGNYERIDFKDFYIDHVGKIEYGFYNDQFLTYVDIRNFKASGSIPAMYCFYNCKALQHLDIRGLDQIGGSNMMTNVPTTCEIIVKNDTIKSWWNANFPSYTNVKTAEEYEG